MTTAPFDGHPPEGTAIGSAEPVAAGPTPVPSSRYTSPDWAERERRRLWPAVWQPACSLDHVREPGDVVEHRCGDLSVLVVRGHDGELRAFQNTCRHRGNALVAGTATGLDELRCPYHRWSWSLDGTIVEIPSRKGFGRLDDEDVALVPVAVDTFGPIVFVNVDPDASSLSEWLGDVVADVAWARPDEYRCVLTTRTPVAANWKVVADGFSETLHVQGIHPEMLAHLDDVRSPQRLFGRHGASYQPYGVPSPRAGRDVGDREVWDSWCRLLGDRLGLAPGEVPDLPSVPAGTTIRDVIAERIRAHSSTRGAPLDDWDTVQVTSSSQYNLFPNSSLLVWAEMANLLVALPGPTPHEATFVTYLFHRYGRGHHPETARPADIDLDAKGTGGMSVVLDQDLAVLESMQRGLRQPGCDVLRLSNEEIRIINMHRHLVELVGDD